VLIVTGNPEAGLGLRRWQLPMQPYLVLAVRQLAARGHLIRCHYYATPAGIRMVRAGKPHHRPT